MSTTGGADVERELGAGGGRIPIDTFAARLILARHDAGQLSQRDAAERCGLNYASWSNWEGGMRPRDLIDVVEQIATGLGIDRDWLLFGGSLAKPGPRVGRRIRPIRRGGDFNVTLSHPVRSAPADHPIRRGVPHTTIGVGPSAAGVSPSVPQRRDSTRPQSPIPATSRRPVATRPPARPMAA